MRCEQGCGVLHLMVVVGRRVYEQAVVSLRER